MGTQSIAVHRVRAALRGAQRLGLDTAPLLQRARIPPLLVGDDRARVTPEQFGRLIRVLLRETGDEFLGLGSVPSRRGTFAMMCHASLACRDLGTALDRAVRFYGLFPGGPELDVMTGPRGAAHFTVRSQLGDDTDHFLAECLLVIWHRLSSWLIGRRVPLLSAEFAYPAPPHHEEYPALFGCTVRFGAHRTGADFDARWLTAPVVRDEQELDELLRRAPADLLSRHAYDTTVAEQVRSTLARALRTGGSAASRLPRAAEVAARLAVSPATLRRRLLMEGTSFQRLKDQARRDAAIAGLVEGQEPIADLAARLGFSEDTAFLRAFRRWTGTTPGAYRAVRRGQRS